jgi:TolB-like protein/DNA-binding winged helix-turn-helix (wHTH) protein/Flp pilus assembly protein TadD
MQPPPTTDNGIAPPRFRIGDLEVDIGKAEVTRGGEKIALPKLSFDLLYALINAAPAIVTNEELLQQVWPGLMVSPESVAQRVKLLRSAIGDDSQQPRYILGVRGRGYRLIPTPERLAGSRSPESPPPESRPPETQPPANGSANGSRDANPTGGPTSRSPPSPSPEANRSRYGRVWLILAIVAVTALVGWAIRGVVARHWPSTATALHYGDSARRASEHSVAVLPFTDMSEKKDLEYFGDGMAEEIINLLDKIPELKIIARTSSFQFKGRTEDLRDIGTKLGVGYVLEGSVRKAGDQLRVTAQLINSRDGTHLWSETYDRDLSDVLKMQDEIAAKVARALQIEVRARDYFASRPSLRNTEAYTLHLRAVHAANRYDRQGFDQELGDERQALDLDPTFAEAAGQLASAYQYGGQVGYLPRDVAFENSRDAAERALRLNPKLVGVLCLRSSIYDVYQWDWAAAEREIDKARAIAPNDPVVVWASMRHSLILGRSDEALRLLNALQELDPLNSDTYYWLALAQLRRGQLPEAEAAIRHALEISPNYNGGQYHLGLVLLARHQTQEALAEMRKEPFDAARLVGTAMAYSALGNRADSDAALAQILEKYPASIPIGVAAVHAFRGEADEAFKWLDRAYDQKDSLLYRIKFSPEFDRIHGDPRYAAFLKKMNLPE